jgi:hypothetical protein
MTYCPKKYVPIFMVLLGTTCVQYVRYTPDPMKDVGQWVANFKQQRSFEYEYRMKTNTTFIQAGGSCVVGRAERNKVQWTSQGSPALTYEYIGLGDIEYQKKNGKWEQSARGEESNMFARVTRMLDFDKFEFISDSQPGVYAYRFKANVPFLAPDKWKQMVGTLLISQKTYLPVLVWAGLPDSSVYWQVSITRYNRVKDINSPVKTWADYVLRGRDSMIEAKQLSSQLKKRLASLGIPYKLNRKDSLLVLSTQAQYNQGDISDMLETMAPVSIYGLAETPNNARRVSRLAGSDQPVYLNGLIADQSVIKEARVLFDDISRPFLSVALKNKRDIPSRVCLEIDNSVVSIISVDKPGKLSKLHFYINTMGYLQLNILKSSLNQGLPLIEVKELPKGID